MNKVILVTPIDNIATASTFEDSFVQAAKDKEPCLGCENRRPCAAIRLACQNFVAWADTGRANDLPRTPAKAAYYVLFPHEKGGRHG